LGSHANETFQTAFANNIMKTLIKWYYRKKALRGFIKKCRLDMEIDKILKEWITLSIVERKHEGRRKELTDAISKEKETTLFYQWLLNQK
jgi:hypothetical protein